MNLLRRIPIPRLALPLLRKEMVETAARGRTYAIRFVYALLLFTAWCLVLWEVYHETSADADRISGQGRRLFDATMWIQLASVYLFLPGMVAGAITSERENKTMTLLIITDLRSWEILVQKMVGRMLPVLTFLFLAFPLAGVAYMYGGVQADQVAVSVYVLVVTAVQIAAATVFVSTFCKTTVSAMLVSYLVGPLIYLMAVIGNVVVGVLWMGIVWAVRAVLDMPGSFESALMVNAFPPSLLFADTTQPLVETLINTVPAWIVAALFILMARDELVAGTLAMGPQAPVSTQFTQTASMPRMYKRDPPGDDPIAWRLAQRPGGSDNTVRVSAVSMLVLAGLLFAMSLTTGNVDASLGLLGFMACVGWLLMTLVVGVLGAGVVAHDRARSTLDVLLATPIPGPWLLWQQEQTARRWRRAFTAVLLALAGVRAAVLLLRSLGGAAPGVEAVVYLAVALAALAVYPRLLSAVAVWIGLRSSTHVKATVTTLAVVAGWCLAWALIPAFVWDLMSRGGGAPAWLGFVSPLSVIAHNEGAAGFETIDLGLIALHFAAYGFAAFKLTRYCRYHADEYLGRIPAVAPPDAPSTEASAAGGGAS